MARQRSNTRSDTDRIKDSAHKLRSENRKLRKDNAKLRKLLSRVDLMELDRQLEELDQTEDLITVPEETSEKLNCPACKTGTIKEIPAGKFLIRLCPCGYRKRSEVKDRQKP